MFLKVFIFLFLAAECRGNIFCNFKKDLCSWSNAYSCHYQHETKTPLAGKTGYLQISKNTCSLATISISVNSEARFRLNYFLNGTDRAHIYIYADYGLTSRSVIWQCTANQGPKWNVAEIYIPSSFFNSLKKVIIQANIVGDATVAIGNIDQPKNGHIQYRCPPSPPIIKPTTKVSRVKITETTTQLVNTGNTHTMCNFKFNLCQWRDIYHKCHFKHVKNTPLLGETGYLMLSKDTCKHASLLVRLKEFKFQLHYLMNGTGNMSLSIGVHYGFAGRYPIWTCSTSQGPKWHKVDITVQLIHFDPIVNIYIDAAVSGDATVAIGNIAKATNGRIEHRCPSSPPIIKPTTKIPSVKITEPTTQVVNTGNTMCNFKFNLCHWRDIYHKCHFKHVKNAPLLGETGYLMLSKDTCKHASLLVRLKEFKFQLHYLMNGTGNMSLSIGVHYGFAGRYPIWTCGSSQGPKWHKVDITVQLIHFDPIVNIYIDAAVSGDATVAIGNIAKAGDGSREKQCQPNSGNLSNH